MTRMGKTLLVLSSVAAAAALALVFMPVEKQSQPPQLTPVQKAELAPPPKPPEEKHAVVQVPPPPEEDDATPQPEIVEDGEGS